jgi:hypothetical protein
MNTTSNLISRLQDIVIRFQMRRAAFLLRQDYNDPSMQEFTALDADEFSDCI